MQIDMGGVIAKAIMPIARAMYNWKHMVQLLKATLHTGKPIIALAIGVAYIYIYKESERERILLCWQRLSRQKCHPQASKYCLQEKKPTY